MNSHFFSEEEKILILNRPVSLKESDFYMFRIPEVFNRLRRYREILSEKSLKTPPWVYNITKEESHPSASSNRLVLSLIIGLGLFDRSVARHGWPKYLAGGAPMISIVTGQRTFESVILALAEKREEDTQTIFLYQTGSFINRPTNAPYLSRLKRVRSFASIRALASYLKTLLEAAQQPVVQFLSPNEERLAKELQPLCPCIQDFLESDVGLRWLWPIWKKAQLKNLKSLSLQSERNRSVF